MGAAKLKIMLTLSLNGRLVAVDSKYKVQNSFINNRGKLLIIHWLEMTFCHGFHLSLSYIDQTITGRKSQRLLHNYDAGFPVKQQV